MKTEPPSFLEGFSLLLIFIVFVLGLTNDKNIKFLHTRIQSLEAQVQSLTSKP